jgi:hypothetical protein
VDAERARPSTSPPPSSPSVPSSARPEPVTAGRPGPPPAASNDPIDGLRGTTKTTQNTLREHDCPGQRLPVSPQPSANQEPHEGPRLTLTLPCSQVRAAVLESDNVIAIPVETM